MRWLLFLLFFFSLSSQADGAGTLEPSESFGAPYPENPTNWIFSRLQLRGRLIGKDKYRQFYVLRQGELFDLAKHHEGVERIHEELRNEGYLDARIIARFRYDSVTHSLAVILNIDHGPLFKIHKAQILVSAQDESCDKDCVSMTHKLQKLATKELVGVAATKAACNDIAKKMNGALAQKGFFNNKIEVEKTIIPETNKVNFCFKVILGQKNLFDFYGNLFFNRQQLLDHILLFGKSVVLIPPSLLAQEISTLYKNAGFWGVTVTWQEDNQATIFIITEGPRAKIRNLTIIGAEQSHEHIFKKKFQPLLTAPFFSEKILQNCLHSITNFYLENGYWDAVIEPVEYTLNHENNYTITLPLKEGKQRFLTGVRIDDDSIVLNELISTSFLTPLPFNIHLLQEQRQKIIKALHAMGKLYATPTPEFKEQSATENGIFIELVWHVQGQLSPVHFGPTVISGVTTIPEELLRKEFTFKEGDLWSRKKIEETVLNIKRLGVFDFVTLTPDDFALPAPHKSLTLKLIQDTPYEARLRLGIQGVNRNIFDFNGGTSYKAGGSFLIKNITNRADKIRFDFDLSRFLTTISASYKIPRISTFPFATEFKAYHSVDDQPVIQGYRDILYKSHQDGFLVNINRKSGGLDWGLTNGIEWMGISDINRQTARDLIFDPVLINQRFPYWYIEPTLFFDYLDNKVEPRYGGMTVISCKGMLPFTLKDASFFKILAEQSLFYSPFNGPVVVAGRLRFGTIFNSNFRRIMPIERFFLGGSHSLRGYEPDFAPPLNTFTNCKGERRLAPVGGKSMVNFNFELRFPLYGALGGVVFTDFGALSDQAIVALQPRNLLSAAGFGLRMNTPVGPLRFDIGWKLKQDEPVNGVCALKRYAWFLTLGEAF